MVITALKQWLASRPRTQKITTIVLHATDGRSAGSSISWLRSIGLSYHYVIERDGTITKCVPISRTAFHAGKSVGPNGSNVNPYSIGVSFANWESHGEQITAQQVTACRELVAALCNGEKGIKFLTTHYWVSPGRKSDPKWLHRRDIDLIAAVGSLEVWKP